MSFGPADFPGFGGLNVSADSEDSPGALDLSNVSLSQPGPSRLAARPGYTLTGTLDLSTVTGWSPVGSSYVAGGATTLQLVSSAGAQTATGTFTTGDPWTVVPFGRPELSTLPTFTNPSFATNTTGWSASGSTITRDTGVFNSTPASGRWDNTGASDSLGIGDILTASTSGTFYRGVTYLVSYALRSSGGTQQVTAKFGSTSDYYSKTVDVAATFNSFVISWTPATTTSSVTFSLTDASGGSYYYVDTLSLDVTTGSAFGSNGAALGRLRTDSTLDAPTVLVKAAGATTYVEGYAAPTPYTLAAQPKDNRLVCWGFATATGGPNGAASSGSHVYFSQPDSPLAYDVTDYLILSPGDGETGRAAATYNDFLFLFKQSKFFVFYGNSVDSTGGAVFNYRTVGNAFGGSSSAIYQGQVCSAPSGVYVITDTGVWKTTGGAPVLVSGALSPLFNQNVSTLAYQGTGYTKLAPRSATGSGGSFWHQGKVYFSVTITRGASTTSSGWLILDEQSGQWVVWELADTPRVGASVSGAAVFPSGLSTSGRKGLLSMDGTATTDNGTAIASYYTSPYLTYGEPKAEKHVRASELHGTGTVTLAWGKDLQTHGTAETVTFSSGVGHARTGARGRALSFKIAASAAGWTVNRVVPLLQQVRTGR